jgi:hypothetical protein
MAGDLSCKDIDFVITPYSIGGSCKLVWASLSFAALSSVSLWAESNSKKCAALLNTKMCNSQKKNSNKR